MGVPGTPHLSERGMVVVNSGGGGGRTRHIAFKRERVGGGGVVWAPPSCVRANEGWWVLKRCGISIIKIKDNANIPECRNLLITSKN